MRRSQALRIYNTRYNHLHQRGCDRFKCFYCGDTSVELDHFPPITLAHIISDKALHLLIPSCSECNSLLGTSLQDSLSERITYLKTRLEHKYRKVLSSTWTKEELEQWKADSPDSRLLSTIKNFSKSTQFITERLSYYTKEYEIKGCVYRNTEEVSLDIGIYYDDKFFESVHLAVAYASNTYSIRKDLIIKKLNKGFTLEQAITRLQFEFNLRLESKKFEHPVRTYNALLQLADDNPLLSVYELIEKYKTL